MNETIRPITRIRTITIECKNGPQMHRLASTLKSIGFIVSPNRGVQLTTGRGTITCSHAGLSKTFTLTC